MITLIVLKLIYNFTIILYKKPNKPWFFISKKSYIKRTTLNIIIIIFQYYQYYVLY